MAPFFQINYYIIHVELCSRNSIFCLPYLSPFLQSKRSANNEQHKWKAVFKWLSFLKETEFIFQGIQTETGIHFLFFSSSIYPPTTTPQPQYYISTEMKRMKYIINYQSVYYWVVQYKIGTCLARENGRLGRLLILDSILFGLYFGYTDTDVKVFYDSDNYAITDNQSSVLSMPMSQSTHQSDRRTLDRQFHSLHANADCF